MDARFDELRNFYRRLDEKAPSSLGLPEALRKKGGNICGSCFECCRFNLILSKHEFDCIEAYLIEKHGRCSVRWITCTTPLQDARLTRPVDPTYRCPLYEEGVGCGVYEVRPLACRLFGPTRPRTTPLPAPCVFTDAVPYDTVQGIPLWDEYAEIVRKNRPNPPGYFVSVEATP